METNNNQLKTRSCKRCNKIFYTTIRANYCLSCRLLRFICNIAPFYPKAPETKELINYLNEHKGRDETKND